MSKLVCSRKFETRNAGFEIVIKTKAGVSILALV
jgi:hypothetical protein